MERQIYFRIISLSLFLVPRAICLGIRRASVHRVFRSFSCRRQMTAVRVCLLGFVGGYAQIRIFFFPKKKLFFANRRRWLMAKLFACKNVGEKYSRRKKSKFPKTSDSQLFPYLRFLRGINFYPLLDFGAYSFAPCTYQPLRIFFSVGPKCIPHKPWVKKKLHKHFSSFFSLGSRIHVWAEKTEKYGSQLYFRNFWRIGRFFLILWSRYLRRGYFRDFASFAHIRTRKKWRDNSKNLLLPGARDEPMHDVTTDNGCCSNVAKKNSSNSDQKPVFPLYSCTSITFSRYGCIFFATAKKIKFIFSSGKRKVRHGKKKETNSNWGRNLFECPDGVWVGATELSAEIRSFFQKFSLLVLNLPILSILANILKKYYLATLCNVKQIWDFFKVKSLANPMPTSLSKRSP